MTVRLLAISQAVEVLVLSFSEPGIIEYQWNNIHLLYSPQRRRVRRENKKIISAASASLR
jgi:hypothetical protein